MKYHQHPRVIYWIQGIGFFGIIALSWINELAELPTVVFGRQVSPNWHEAAIETATASLVWLATYFATRRVMKRIRYLEEFLRVCAWCRKVGHDGEWISLEQYFGRQLGTRTTHGICPDCARKQRELSKG